LGLRVKSIGEVGKERVGCTGTSTSRLGKAIRGKTADNRSRTWLWLDDDGLLHDLWHVAIIAAALSRWSTVNDITIVEIASSSLLVDSSVDDPSTTDGVGNLSTPGGFLGLRELNTIGMRSVMTKRSRGGDEPAWI
jgi:hypothetical protein